jgi:ankyrin repeat protein
VKKRLLVVVLVGAATFGCVSGKRTTFVNFDPLGHGPASARSGPAEFTSATDDSLLSAGYAMIGAVASEQVAVRCYDDETVVCDTVCTVSEHLAGLLEEAGRRGGDLVSPTAKAWRSARPSVKRGDCLEQETTTTTREWIQVTEYITETRCVRYEWIHGTEISLKSGGSLWRMDPEHAREQQDGRRLADAARRGDSARLRELLSQGIPVDARGSDGLTALSAAVGYDRADAVRILLEHGADPNVFGQHGTPLHVAAEGGHSAMVELMLEHGADVAARLSEVGGVMDGATPLHSAARGGSGEVVRLLLGAGADIEALTDEDMTPLMVAAAYGLSGEVVEALLDGYPDTDADCGSYMYAGRVVHEATALDLAIIHGNADAIIALIRRVGATDIAWANDFWTTFWMVVPDQVHQLVQGYEYGVYGYVDRSGRLVVPPSLPNAGPFSEGLAAARRGCYFGYLDKQGRFAIPQQFEGAGVFSDGLAAASSDGLWGYIDASGEYVITRAFLGADPFSEGLAGVNMETDAEKNYYSGGEWGYIDKTGKVVVEADYRGTHEYSEGFASVCKSWPDDYRIVNKNGEQLGKTGFAGTSRFSEGLAAVMDEQFGYIDTNGEFAISPQFAYAGPFKDGLAGVGVIRDGATAHGYIDRTGSFVIGPHEEWLAVGDFSDGLAWVKVSDGAAQKYGYVDRTGRFAIEPRFLDARPFSDGLAGVAVPDEDGWRTYGFIDKSGRFAVEPVYNDVGEFSDGMAWVKKRDRDWWVSEWSRLYGAPLLANRHGERLRSAAMRGNVDLARTAIEDGADVDSADADGTTALMAAILAGSADVADLLLRSDADADKQDSDGYTALIYAAGSGDLSIVRKLLEAGADAGLGTGETGMTALSFAELNGHGEVAQLLREAGAR